jgi:hypothetical protein
MFMTGTGQINLYLDLLIREILKYMKRYWQFHFFFYYFEVVRKRTIPTERPPLVGKFSANLCG